MKITNQFAITCFMILITLLPSPSAAQAFGESPEIRERIRLLIEKERAQNGFVPDPPNSIRFLGKITKAAVEEFIKHHEGKEVSLLFIYSLGGDTEAAIRLANWVLDRNMDVHVEHVCASGCAYYVLAAGRNKSIGPKAVVVWHGGMHQKNFREGYQKFLIQERAWDKLGREALSVNGLIHYSADKAFWDTYIRVRNAEDKFTQRAGINEYMFRMGHEPIFYKEDCWIATPEVMASMGYAKLTASDPSFGTAKSLKGSMTANITCPGVVPTVFKFDGKRKFIPDTDY